MNYAKRANLAQKYPRTWEQSPEIIHDVMPKITEPVSPTASPLRGIIQAWTRYPKECLSNTAFNVKMATITLPTILRGSNRENFAETPASVWQDLIALAAANLSLIGVALFFLVMWRYYFPLLPVFIVGLGLSGFIARSTQFKTAGACK